MKDLRHEANKMVQIRERKKIFLSIERKKLMKIMAQENDPMMAEVMNLLEVEPAGSPAAAPGPNGKPALGQRST